MSLDDQDLSALIRQHATRHAVPDALQAGIRTQVALAEAGRSPSPDARRQPWWSFNWRTATAGFALGLACAWVVPLLLQRLAQDVPMEQALVGSHVQALKTGPLTQVASSDRHTVKPWFQGRLDYAPTVFDLAADGFPLVGGRVEQLRGNTVAALAYTRNRHVIDVYVWPVEKQQAPGHGVHRGFNVLHWTDGHMQYWAVSDLEHAELARFMQLWQGRAAAL